MNKLQDESPAPYGLYWSLGKTFASYIFVVDAERYLQTCTDPLICERLQIEVDRIKLGEVELRSFRDTQDVIEHLE